MVNVPSKVGDSDSPKLAGASSGPALPALILPPHSAASQDLPPLSPTILPPPSSHHQHSIPVRPSRSRSPSPQLPARSSGQTTPLNEYFPFSARPKIVDRWANGPVIGIKSVPNGNDHPISSSTSPTRSTFRKIALPGSSRACAPPPLGTDSPEDHVPSPVFTIEPPQEKPQERNSVERRSSADKPQPRRPAVPHKPSRIPSTGNRATVMDVAQVWSEHGKHGPQNVSSPRPASPNSPLESRSVHPMRTQARPDNQRERQEQGEPPGVVVKAADARTSISASPVPDIPNESEKEKGASLKLPDLLTPTEQRKLSWEKYSELIMPALEEEWTPFPSPMPTLKKKIEVPGEAKVEQVTATTPETKRPGGSGVDYLPLDLLSTTLEPERKAIKVSPADLTTFGKITRLFPLPMLISY